ncbi:ATP-binding protein [Rhizobium sp. R693]|uniref:slr1658 superfamily regulator n=1 Tax=Rhizobium sp. R693 TaxID=1764276 RepID=UPI000B52BB81|nr:ATP-binding protein [Rhizobium sp. R693]OWW00415.1 ATP-binding protein [Rhizobium sp. R693]
MTTMVFGQEHLTFPDTTHAFRLRLLDGPLDLAWKHSGMTSDFIAEMMAPRFRPSKRIYNQLRQDIGYLANELIENAIKFRVRGEVVIEAIAQPDYFRLRVTNFVDSETADRFKQLLGKVTSNDPGDLLIRQIEANAMAVTGEASGLGLLTLMSDYEVQFAWRFEEDNPHERTRLETYAAMAIPA